MGARWVTVWGGCALCLAILACCSPSSTDGGTPPEGSGEGASGASGEGTGIPMAEPPPPAEPTPVVEVPPPLTGPAKHEYTSVALHEDCKRLDTPPEGEPDWAGEYDCPGFGGYEVRIGTADLRSSLSLVKDGQAIHFGSDPNFKEPGQFAYVTDKKIEWRYRRSGDEERAHALIFRVFGQDPETYKDVSHLTVARLEGSRGCVLGTTASNTEAREMADDVSRRCP